MKFLGGVFNRTLSINDNFFSSRNWKPFGKKNLFKVDPNQSSFFQMYCPDPVVTLGRIQTLGNGVLLPPGKINYFKYFNTSDVYVRIFRLT